MVQLHDSCVAYKISTLSQRGHSYKSSDVFIIVFITINFENKGC